MNPEPFYFGPAHRPLLGWFHAPTGAWRDTAVVLCPPLGYQHLASYRTMGLLAARLSGLGFAVVRFDYPGMGDSAGDEDESGLVRDWVEAIHLAGAEARRLSGATRTAAVGLGVGGMLAAAAGSQQPFDALVLWAPVESGRKFIRELRVLQGAGDDSITSRDGLEAGGFIYPDALAAEIEALDLLRPGQSPARLMLLASRDDLPPLQRLEQRLRATGAELTVSRVCGMRQVMDVPTTSVVPAQAAIEHIAIWLGDTFAACGAAPAVALPRATRVTMPVPGSSSAVVEEAVWFGDHGLSGIVSEPMGSPASNTALLLLNSGRERRIGTSRMWVRLGRAWAAEGFRVLRMDIAGLGDSPVRPGGREDAAYSDDAPRDISDAVAFLLARGATSVIPMGLCSGGYWAVRAAGSDLPLKSVCAVNPQLYWRPGEPEIPVRTLGAAREMERMTQSATSPAKWGRLLTGQVPVRHVVRTMWRRVAPDNARRRLRRRGHAAILELRQLQRLPGESLLVFAAEDYGLTFLQQYQRRPFQQLVSGSQVQLQLVPDADHSFTGAGPRMVLEKMLYQHVMDVAAGEA
jgi:pimeloyl-ACP methyl ester carboxylesterase